MILNNKEEYQTTKDIEKIIEEVKHQNYSSFFAYIKDFRREFINQVRRLPNQEDLKDLISAIIDYQPLLCFKIIYDKDEFQEEVKSILNSVNASFQLWTPYRLKKFLENTTWGKEYVYEHFDELMFQTNFAYSTILSYVSSHIQENSKLAEKIQNSPNTNVRLLFYSELAKLNPQFIEERIPNILSLLEEGKKLKQIELSRLATRVVSSGMYPELWRILKEYILTHYEKNDLGRFLMQGNFLAQQVFLSDFKTFFDTSRDARLDIYNKYIQSNSVSKKVLADLQRHLELLKVGPKNITDERINAIFFYELDRKMEEYMDLYLAKSKSNEVGFLSSGTTTSCYRLGDYVIKLSNAKHSSNKIICPNLYLILKNLEECYVRGKSIHGSAPVYAALEIQKYLERSSDHVSTKKFLNMAEQFKKLGYCARDLIKENCRFLDTYWDADCDDPEQLPKAFKESPLVLVDRDLVYPIDENGNPIQEYQKVKK